MITNPISITASSALCSLGENPLEIWENYTINPQKHFATLETINNQETVVGRLCLASKKSLEVLKNSNSHYKNLDPTVLMALHSSRKAIEKAGWNPETNFGINIGSSRGATTLFEKYHQEFITTQKSSTLASPTTTLGNISSWVAHDLQSQGPQISHSITCSTALHAVLNGVAWLQSGICDYFLVGGSEAPLTPFTLAQIKALKVYSRQNNEEYPCRALDLDKKYNQMFLAEGAAVFCLEKGKKTNAMAHIIGIGYATEPLTHNISITSDAVCFQKSMQMALQNHEPKSVDAVVMHAPGTIKGDLSEYRALQKIFGENTLPFLTTNKWKIGHSFGASGALSLDFALMQLQHQKAIGVPFGTLKTQETPKNLKRILVNAVGFGGNAVSLLIEK